MSINASARSCIIKETSERERERACMHKPLVTIVTRVQLLYSLARIYMYAYIWDETKSRAFVLFSLSLLVLLSASYLWAFSRESGNNANKFHAHATETEWREREKESPYTCLCMCVLLFSSSAYGSRIRGKNESDFYIIIKRGRSRTFLSLLSLSKAADRQETPALLFSRVSTSLKAALCTLYVPWLIYSHTARPAQRKSKFDEAWT